MLIGVPREIKTNENRVALVPAGAEALVQHGHQLFIERGAGLGSGFSDAQYEAAGATVLETADEVWARAGMIMKVKKQLTSRRRLMVMVSMMARSFPKTDRRRWG